MKDSKLRLLALPMNQLGITGGFNGWFYRKHMEQKDVLTLAEFISLNHDLKNGKERFICGRNAEVIKKLRMRNGFIKNSVSFKKLKKLLIENGFNHQDWTLLLPEIETPKGFLPNYALLDKKSLLKLSLYKVTNIKENCFPAKGLKMFFSDMMMRDYNQPILVKDILALNGRKVELMFEKGYGNRTLEKTLISTQKKFKEYGLSKEDGPFMCLNLPFTKSKEDYIEDLIANKGFTSSEASIAVDFGLKAGWIQV